MNNLPDPIETIQSESLAIHHFPFCIISTLSKNCAEIVFKDGTEVTKEMLLEIHQWLSSNIDSPMYIIINKIFPHSYTFNAQMELSTLSNIKAMAMVCYSNVSQATTMIMQTATNQTLWNMKIFYDRADALDWIEEQQNT